MTVKHVRLAHVSLSPPTAHKDSTASPPSSTLQCAPVTTAYPESSPRQKSRPQSWTWTEARAEKVLWEKAESQWVGSGSEAPPSSGRDDRQIGWMDGGRETEIERDGGMVIAWSQRWKEREWAEFKGRTGRSL